MNQDLKIKIVEKAQQWSAASGMSQNELARHSKVNAGYISNMLRKNFITTVDGKEVPIGDKQFYQLAEATGYSVKKQFWGFVQTREFESIIHELTVAKNDDKISIVISDTGLGKTYAVEKFCLNNALHTYKITVNSMTKVKYILNEIADMLGVGTNWNALTTLMNIARKVKELKMQGHQPLIIIDEAENLKLPVIQMLKGLYDWLNGYGSIVLIGTPQLIDTLERMVRTNKNGAPQFYRRVKAGIRNIPVYRDFTPFYSKFKVDDKGLKTLLNSLCNNYGELHDYLEPALKESDKQDTALTEDFFRIMYNMPKFK